MIRWLAILFLLASCQGCMIFDDLAFYDQPMPPANTCGMSAAAGQQTVEPPLR
jgi:hypothetical protein